MTRDRVLVIGLDGGTWTILDPWIRDGTLPALGRIRERGAWGPLTSTLPPLTPPAWATFLTGKGPGKHGVFHFAEASATTADFAAGTPQLVDSRSIQSSTLWDILGHHGRRIVTINVPMSYPPRPVPGVMVTCLLTPPDAPVFTYPPELSPLLSGYRIDLERFIGEKPFARDEDGARHKRIVEPTLELVREFHEMEETRVETALELMRSEPWDAFTVVFTAPDRMGHYLWPYHFSEDDTAPAMEPSMHRALHAAIRDVYRVIDRGIGRLIDEAGPNAHVILLSDHGMGPAYSKNVQWDSWLHSKGLVALDRDFASSPDTWMLRLGIPRDRLGAAVRRIPGLRSSRAVGRARASKSARVDLQRSTAYYVRLYDPLGGIRINATGAARASLRDRLRKEIKELTDPSTGRPVVRQVIDREECYSGPYARSMPDLLILMEPEYGSSDRLSSYSRFVTKRASVGDPGGHRSEGIFAIAGPAVTKRSDPLDGVGIVDIAPTVLHLLDLPVPDDMDGRVVLEALDPATRAARPVRRSPPVPYWPSDEAVEDLGTTSIHEDDPQVRERLRALGYVE